MRFDQRNLPTVHIIPLVRIFILQISFPKETQGSGDNFGCFDGVCIRIAKPSLSDFKMHRFNPVKPVTLLIEPSVIP